MTAALRVLPAPVTAGTVLSTAIMTHPARAGVANELARRHPQLAARIVCDPCPGEPGGTVRTARLAWSAVAPDATHHLVLQDDVELSHGFRDLALEAARRLPEHALALFTEWGSKSSHAVRLAALAGASWVEVVDTYIPTQALLLPAAIARGFVDFAAEHDGEYVEDDSIMYDYLRTRGVPMVVSVPNIVEHRDLPSIAGNEEHGRRRSVCWSAPGPPALTGPLLSELTAVPYFSWVTGNAYCQHRPPGADCWTKLDARAYLRSRGVTDGAMDAMLADVIAAIADDGRLFADVSEQTLAPVLLTAFVLGVTATEAGISPGRHASWTADARRALDTFTPGVLRCFVQDTALDRVVEAVRPAAEEAVRRGLGWRAGGPPELVGRAEWDRQYREGRWAYLAEDTESVRYRAVAAEIEARGATSVLDLGCGSGLLQKALSDANFPGRYLGLDWSLDALPRGMSGTAHHVVCADVTALPVRARFDVIVLNEVLYYLTDTAVFLDGLARLLASGGTIIVSMFQPDGVRRPRWRAFVDELAAVLAERCAIRCADVACGSRRWTLYIIDGRP